MFKSIEIKWKRLALWFRHKVFMWLWPEIQNDMVENPGLWANALRAGEIRKRQLIGGAKL